MSPNEMDHQSPRDQDLVNVSEAAELTGLTAKALRRRLERGTLRAVKRRGRRMIPISELESHNLLAPNRDAGASAAAAASSNGQAAEASATQAAAPFSEQGAPGVPPAPTPGSGVIPPPAGQPVSPPAPAPQGSVPPTPGSPLSPSAQPVAPPSQPVAAPPVAPPAAAAAAPQIAAAPQVAATAPVMQPRTTGLRYYWYAHPFWRAIAILAALAIIGLLVWLLLIRDDNTAPNVVP